MGKNKIFYIINKSPILLETEVYNLSKKLKLDFTIKEKSYTPYGAYNQSKR